MFKVPFNQKGGLRQSVRKKLGRKRKGNVIDWLGSFIFILAFIMLMISYMNFKQVFGIKEDVKQISREYMLRMETVGYLTPEDAASLRSRLQSLGVAGIDLGGSTTGGPAGYGNRIILSIKGSLPAEELVLNNDLFTAVFQDTTYPLTVIRESTAKY